MLVAVEATSQRNIFVHCQMSCSNERVDGMDQSVDKLSPGSLDEF